MYLNGRLGIRAHLWSAGAPGALRSLLRTEFSRLRTELSPHQAVGLKPCAVGTNHAIWTAPTAPMTKNQYAISPGGLDSSLRRRADPQGKRPSRQGPPYRPRALSCRPHLSADFANGLNRLPGARGASATKHSAATGSLSLFQLTRAELTPDWRAPVRKRVAATPPDGSDGDGSRR